MIKAFRLVASAALVLIAPLPALAAELPPNGGSLSIEVAPANGADAPSAPSFVSAATEALAARGFTILEDPGHSAFVAELVVRRSDVGTGSVKVKPGRGVVGPGAGGAGVIIPLPTGNTALVPLQRTELELRLRKRGDPAVIWHGTAMTVRSAGTRTGTDDAVATALSEALLRGYPAEPEGVVGVP